ncbi:hypothetical protein NV379_11220 [Paenibacillus sp. N1-5-1-14]|uniref:hypothetical protein n=1 Tax=Paenibacillus radicibacter TaxID=2972488 RepID=UPI0021592C4C|nr:hypothetical protein [Paenibacillus radicibacter]MCR8643231.1 hypothetical protein [Paenibacillus radicibacter]
MKWRLFVGIMITAFILLTSCTSKPTDAPPKQDSTSFVYMDQQGEWLATYSVFKVKTSYFESLYLQYIGEDRGAKIGPIEYKLVGEGMEWASQYPQDLQGVRSFHTSSEINADILPHKPTKDSNFKLEIKYQGKSANFTLKAMQTSHSQ